MIFLNTHYFSHFFYLIKIFNLFFFQLRISGMIEMVWRSSVSSDAQQCPTLCDPRDCSPRGSSVHGILLARILERVAISSSSGSSWPRDWTRVSYASCIGRWILHHQCYLGSPRRGSINKSLPNASMALHSEVILWQSKSDVSGSCNTSYQLNRFLNTLFFPPPDSACVWRYPRGHCTRKFVH